MQELGRRGIPFNAINAGQHGALIGDLIHQFELPLPDVSLRSQKTNIASVPQAMGWFAGHLSSSLFKPRDVFSRVFREQNGICLIHGDTLTTLVSLVYAKRCKLVVAHVEAGLRSFHLLHPFPEEIIRRITMFSSNLLFAPSLWAFENLKRMGYASKAFNIGANTGEDAIRYALARAGEEGRPKAPYVVATVHRFETIYSRSRLTVVLELLERIAAHKRVLLVLHDPTRQQMAKSGLLARISKTEGITLSPLLPYLQFVNLLAGADYVITDGGSIQEECYYLDKPCLVMRSRTERMEGIGENALVVGFDPEQMDAALLHLPLLKRKGVERETRPSALIVDHILQWA